MDKASLQTEQMKETLKAQLRKQKDFSKTSLSDSDLDFILQDVYVGMNPEEGLSMVMKRAKQIDTEKRAAEMRKARGLDEEEGIDPLETILPKTDQTKVKKVDLSKYDDAALNALVAEDKKILAEANKLSEAGTNYGRVQEIQARRKEIKEILEAAQAVPESGYGNIKADLALEKQVSKTKKDSLPMRLIKDYEKDLDVDQLLAEGYSSEQAEILFRAREKMKLGEEMNPNEALLRVKEEYADAKGVDVDEIDIDFQIDDPEPTDFAKGGLAGVLGV